MFSSGLDGRGLLDIIFPNVSTDIFSGDVVLDEDSTSMVPRW